MPRNKNDEAYVAAPDASNLTQPILGDNHGGFTGTVRTEDKNDSVCIGGVCSGRPEPKAKFVEIKPGSFSELTYVLGITSTSEPEEKNNDRKLLYIDSRGWPIEGIIGMPFTTFFHRLFFTRKIMRYKTWLAKGGCKINFK